MNRSRSCIVLPILITALAGCSPESPPATATPSDEGTPPPSNRIAIGGGIAENLGLSFVAATRGTLSVEKTVAGQIAVPAGRTHRLRTPVDGRVRVLVERWQRVATGDELLRIETSEIDRLRARLEDTEADRILAAARENRARKRLAAHDAHLAEARSLEAAARRRLGELEAIVTSGGRLTSRELLEARTAVVRAADAVLSATDARDAVATELGESSKEVRHAYHQREVHLAELAVLAGQDAESLTAIVDERPRWQTLRWISVRAPADGTIAELTVTDGVSVHEGDLLLTLVDRSELQFEGFLPEGEPVQLRGGMPVRIVFPNALRESISTTLAAPLPVADTRTRAIRVLARFADAEQRLASGLSAVAHVEISRGSSEEVLLDVRAIGQDGLESVVFVRDPSDPQKLIRTPVTLGRRNTKEVEILAGLLDGDEVVLDGLQPLLRMGEGKAPMGGHFHADGTWHADDDHK